MFADDVHAFKEENDLMESPPSPNKTGISLIKLESIFNH